MNKNSVLIFVKGIQISVTAETNKTGQKLKKTTKMASKIVENIE